MTTTSAGTATAITPTVRQSVRRARFWLLIAGVVVVLALIVLVGRGLGTDTTTFGPDNAAPTGARALVQVLGQQGVAVRVVATAAEARSEASGATLVIDDQDTLIDTPQVRRLLASTSRVVVVNPSFTTLSAISSGLHLGGEPKASSAVAGCALPAARRAGTMSLAGAGSSITGAGTRCFADGSGRAQLVQVTRAGTTVAVLASSVPFDNEHIATSGNAAVALGVLGERGRLVWLRPSLTGAGATPTLATLTPTWVTPFLIMLLVAFVAAGVWRGRRLGPLVVERLPVVVRSRETVEGRARLYRRSGAALRAADAIRMGTLDRLAPRLGLSRLASVDEVIAASAGASGWSVARVRAALLTDEPASERALLALSDELTRLERAVRAGHEGTP